MTHSMAAGAAPAADKVDHEKIRKDRLSDLIGLKVHDVGPLLGPDWPERYGDPVFFTIEPDQVFAVEPMLYVKPEEIGYDFHMGLEENLVVGEDGARFIGTPQTSLILIS